jgi:hypothetical protein
MSAHHFRPLLSGVASALLLLSFACSNGAPTTNQEVGPPASVTVAAGNNQVAVADAAVATAPAVVVRDAAGHAVPSVAVTFSVDSGGGSIATASMSTDASGTASPGTWTLGASGPQVLGVIAGTLAKIKIRATIVAVETTPVTGTVTSGASTLTIDQAGSPLKGVSITIQNGAVAAAAPITIAAGSTAGVDLPAGVTATSPALTISSSARLTKPAVVKFPVTAIPGTVQFIGVFSLATGKVAVLPPLSNSATELTAMLPRLESSLVAAPTVAPGFFRGAGARADDGIGVFTMEIPLALLDRDFTSQFTAGVDNWDFDNLAIAWLPFLAGTDGGDPAEEVIDPADGMITTSLWYFLTQRASGQLSKRFRLQPDQLRSNRAGIRWAALVNRASRDQHAQLSKTVKDFRTDDLAAYTEQQFLALKLMMYLSQRDRPFAEPVPVFLYSDLPRDGKDDVFAVDVGIATRTIGQSVEFVVAENEERAYRGTLATHGFNPVTVINRSGYSYTFSSFSPQMTTPFIDNPAIAANWPKVLNGTVGNAEGWPQPELHWEKGKLDTGAVFLGDKVEMWWECPACTDFGIISPAIPAAASHLQPFRIARVIGGTATMSPSGEQEVFASMKWSADSVESDVNPTRTVHALYMPQPRIEGIRGFPAGWLDWQTVSFRKMSLKPTPAALTFGKDTTATWTLAPSVAPPAGTTWSWILVTADSRDSVATSTPTRTWNLKSGGDAKLVILAHEKDTKRVIARDTVVITAVAGNPYWIITSMSDQDQLFNEDQNGAGGEAFDRMKRVVTAPQSGLIGVIQNGSVSEFFLRVRPGSLWTGTESCCPPLFAPTDSKEILGVTPAIVHTFGAFFNQYQTSSWSQTTTDLNSGTMTGSYAPGSANWPISGGGVQNGPGYAVRITATRSGNTMTGVITLTNIFLSDDGQGLTPGDLEEFRFPFTAVRLP